MTRRGAKAKAAKAKPKPETTSRRGTLGSRLSLHSLLFSSSKGDQQRNMSRSAQDLQRPGSDMSGADSASERESLKQKEYECPLCFVTRSGDAFPQLSCCTCKSCQPCLVQYLTLNILESRVQIACPQCSEHLHPSDIYRLLSEAPQLIEKYENFSLRRILMADPDTRWCPAPDCNYAVIAAGCAGCPVLKCERCQAQFCYHCKMLWHPNQTCDEARVQRGSYTATPLHIDTTVKPGDIKACPRCRTYIVKMNDGSCNHMVCAVCGAEFCWLCLKEISDLHYLSPSGCTFWGKKPWSRKKKLLWQLGTLIGAPVGIGLVAGLAVPAIVFGVPVWVGRKIHQKTKGKGRLKHHLAVGGGVVASLLASPILATVAVGVGVPIMIAYVYGVVPLSLCRNGTCGVSASSSGLNLDLDDDLMAMTALKEEQELQQNLLSKEEVQSVQSGFTQHRLQIQVEVFPRRRGSIESSTNYEEASTRACAGSTYYDDKSVHTMGSVMEGGSYCEEASVKAMAGSIKVVLEEPIQFADDEPCTHRKTVDKEAEFLMVTPEMAAAMMPPVALRSLKKAKSISTLLDGQEVLNLLQTNLAARRRRMSRATKKSENYASLPELNKETNNEELRD